MTKIISRNTTIPVKKSELFSTAIDNQANVEIHILQGERELVAGNKSLGNFRLDGIPEAKRGVPKIDVTFDINVDGLLAVKAKEKETGVEQSVTIQGTSNLNKDEIDTMLADAEKFASEDQQQRELIDLKNVADQSCKEAENLLEQLKLTTPEEQKQKISTLIEKIKSLMNEDDKTNLEKAVEELKFETKELLNIEIPDPTDFLKDIKITTPNSTSEMEDL